MWLTAEGTRMERIQYCVMPGRTASQPCDTASVMSNLCWRGFADYLYRMCISWRRLLIFLQCLQVACYIYIYINYFRLIQCESKKVAPLKLFAVLSLPVNMCNWKLSYLLPKHIPMSTPILVHLPAYLCEIYHFYRCDPSNFKNSI